MLWVRISLPLSAVMTSIPVYGQEWEVFVATPRVETSDSVLTYGIFASLLVIALSRLYKPSIFEILVRVVFRNQSVLQLVREYYNIITVTDFLLLINFFGIVGMGSVLFVQFPEIPYFVHFVWPLVLFLALLFPLAITSFVTGESVVFRENRYNLFLVPQIVSILVLPMVIIGHLNPELIEILQNLFFGVLGLLFLYLNLRGIVFSLQQSISWYYIILYICTFEILPLTVIFYGFVGR
jgi:hypothetical protein